MMAGTATLPRIIIATRTLHRADAVVINLRGGDVTYEGLAHNCARGISFKIATYFLCSMPRLLLKGELEHLIYGDCANGGPLWVWGSLSKPLRCAREFLRGLGFKVFTHYGRGWRVEPTRARLTEKRAA